jgi:hypothetical protein
MGAQCACAERGKYHGRCIGGMWDVAGLRWWRGQGRAGQGRVMEWNGMAWHGMAMAWRREKGSTLVLARRTMAHGEVSKDVRGWSNMGAKWQKTEPDPELSEAGVVQRLKGT